MDKNEWIWIIAIILIIGGIFMFHKPEGLFSIQDLETKYGAVIKIDSSNPLFNKNNVIAIETTMTCPVCIPEHNLYNYQTSSLMFNGIKLQECPITTCEGITQDKTQIASLSQQTTTSAPTITEISPSMIQNLLVSGPVSGISFYQRVECIKDSQCLDVIRLQQFSCDLKDYTCKLPSLVGQTINTSITSTNVFQPTGGGVVTPPPPEQSQGIPGGGLIVLAVLIGGGYYIYKKYK